MDNVAVISLKFSGRVSKDPPGIGLVDEVHVIASDLLGRRGQVVEVQVRNGARPVGVDSWHVHPRHEWSSEGVEETVFGLIDTGDTEDVVDVIDDGDAGVGNEVRGRVAET